MKVEDTRLEVTYQGILMAIDGDAERMLTNAEFRRAFEQMADKLYELDGLVDPSLWGQASSGRVELEFTLLSANGAKRTAACAVDIIAEVGAAGGVHMDHVDQCSNPAEYLGGSLNSTIPNIDGLPQQRPCLILHGTHDIAEVSLKQ